MTGRGHPEDAAAHIYVGHMRGGWRIMGNAEQVDPGS